MKKVLILISLVALPFISVAQNDSSNRLYLDVLSSVESTTNQTNSSEQIVLTTEAKAELSTLSYKKSNDLISIKAYRKSLQIKVKTIKMC